MTMRVAGTSSLASNGSWRMGAMVLMTGVLALWGATKTPADEVTKTFPVTGHARVHVETDDAAVRVSTGDIKQVEVRVDYSGYKLDRDLRVTTSQNGDSVDVSVKTGGTFWNWGARHTSLRVEIHMPKEADLTIRTGDGNVQANHRRWEHYGARRQGHNPLPHWRWPHRSTRPRRTRRGVERRRAH